MRLRSVAEMHDESYTHFTHRHVVTSFVCKLENESFKNFKVAIFKRGTKVSTHQQLWSACSGSIDKHDCSPQGAAWRELEEETGLTEDDMELLHVGKRHDVFSKDLARRWTIHPFAFVLKPGARDIKLNWENTDVRFVDPEEVETYSTVPDLDITLWRTLVGPDTAKGLRALSDDTTSGARTLATKAVRVLLMAVTGSDLDWSSNVTSYWRGFRLVAWHLANGRPSMGAAIERAVLRVVVIATPGIQHAQSVDEAKAVIVRACNEALEERVSGRGRVAHEFVKYISDSSAQSSKDEVTFLTLSISCAKLCILEYIRSTSIQKVHVIVLESRPCFEGVHMTVDLARQTQELGPEVASRVRFTLAADAAVGTLSSEVDFVILGGDRINPQGDLSNKIGSLSAVLTARAMSNKPCQVLVGAETEKISRRRDVELHNEKHLCSDLMNVWKISQSAKDSLQKNAYVEIATPLFEWVPSRFIDAYITEKGPLKREEVTSHSDIASHEWDAVFETL